MRVDHSGLEIAVSQQEWEPDPKGGEGWVGPIRFAPIVERKKQEHNPSAAGLLLHKVITGSGIGDISKIQEDKAT